MIDLSGSLASSKDDWLRIEVATQSIYHMPCVMALNKLEPSQFSLIEVGVQLQLECVWHLKALPPICNQPEVRCT